jgi:hypothetical protein
MATLLRRGALGLALASAAVLTSGCAVVAIADTAASAVIGVGGLVVDAAVGTVRIGGKVIGAGADAVLGSDAEK